MVSRAESKVRRFCAGLTDEPTRLGTFSLASAVLGSRLNGLFIAHQLQSFSKNAFVDAACSHCSLCVRICPTGNIAEVDGAIVFGTKCAQCLRCFYSCPASAIQAGEKTVGARRYRGPLGDYSGPTRPIDVGAKSLPMTS